MSVPSHDVNKPSIFLLLVLVVVDDVDVVVPLSVFFLLVAALVCHQGRITDTKLEMGNCIWAVLRVKSRPDAIPCCLAAVPRGVARGQNWEEDRLSDK